jgi:hypothetical protein
MNEWPLQLQMAEIKVLLDDEAVPAREHLNGWVGDNRT